MSAGQQVLRALLGACVLSSGCVAELPPPPLTPVVYAAPALVNNATLTLRGLKQASTAIVLATNEVLVGLPDGGPLDRIEVSDVAGRVLRVHGPSIATPQRISLEGLDPGTYLVRVARAGRTSSRKLVVQ